MDAAVLLWFRQKAVLPNTRIDSEMQKAEYFAKEFDHEQSQISSGWIDRFKKRWGIGRIQKTGEA